MFKIALLLFALAVLDMSLGSSTTDENHKVKRGSSVRFCGQRLVQALSLFCNGEYYDPEEESSVQTRNVPFSLDGPFQNWIAVTLSSSYTKEDGSQAISEQVPTSHLFKRYGQLGVVDECCRKACTISVLLSYCRPSD